MISAVPQLMFQGAVQDIVALWSRAFPDMQVEPLSPEGAPAYVQVTVAGQVLRLFDSPVEHAFSLTPSFSFLVTCDNREELNRLLEVLGEGGNVLMPLAEYDFSPCYTWISDRFGVSWQLMLADGK